MTTAAGPGTTASPAGTRTTETSRRRTGRTARERHPWTPSERRRLAEIGAFGHCLRDGTRPTHTEREGIAVDGMVLAADEGARTGTIAPVLQVDPVRA